MSNKTDTRSNTPQIADSDFVALQMSQSMETYRAQFSLLVQVLTVLVVADISVIGYAVSAHSAGVMLIGALFPILILYIIYRVNRLMLPIIYTAISLEKRFGMKDVDWLASTFVAVGASLDSVNALIKISSEKDGIERIKKLKKLKSPVMGSGRGYTQIVFLIIFLGQIAVPLVLAKAYQWQLF